MDPTPFDAMQARLKRVYLRWLLPPLAAAAALLLLEQVHPALASAWAGRIEAALPWLFGASAALAVAGPVMVRAVFAHGVQNRRRVPAAAYYRFRLRLVYAAVSVPYLALWVVGTGSAGFFRSGIWLAALYAVYYGYPSRQRVDFDRRLFRVTAER